MARGTGWTSTAAQFAGAAVGGSLTPEDLALGALTGGWGKGLGLARQVLIGAVAQGGAEVLMTPQRQRSAEALGRDSNMALNVAGAMAFGVAMPVAGRAFEAERAKIAADWTAATPIEEQVARAIEGAELPPLRDDDFLRAFDAALPEHRRTPTEQAASDVVADDVRIEGTNPFEASHAGLSEHRRRLQEATQRMIGGGASPRARPAAARPTPGFEPAWQAIIGIEGGTNRDGSFRTSPAGAIGPAQVMPGTAPEAARLAGLPFDNRRYRTDPEYNIALGRAYFREMARLFGGDLEKAAAAYNTGPGNLRKALARAAKAGRPDDWAEFLPYKETKDYVRNFRRRTGGEARMEVATDAAPPPPRPGADDAELRAGDAERMDIEMEQLRIDAEVAGRRGVGDIEMPRLRPELFPSEPEWRAAQAMADSEVLGIEPIAPAALTVDEAVAGQRAYIAAERERYGQLDVLRQQLAGEPDTDRSFSGSPYQRAASELGLHPLSDAEIRARFAELDTMEANAPADMARAVELSNALRPRSAAPEAQAASPAALPDDLAAVSTPYGVSSEGEHLSGFHMFEGPQGRFTWHPEDGIANGAFPKRTKVTAADVRAFVKGGSSADVRRRLDVQAEALREWDDSAGPSGAAQAQSLLHDLKALTASDDAPAVRIDDEGKPVGLAELIEDIDEDFALVEAIRGCL
jgi:hypothetical protein